jgi:polar amino acid transport system permease protein
MLHPFGPNDFWFIIFAVRWTILLSLIAFVGGAALGLVVALCRVSNIKALRLLTGGFIRVIQGTPLLMQVFLVFFGVAVIGYNVSAMAAAAICLIINTSAFLGETWRGCIEAIPRGQSEAASALGLGSFDRFIYVILPQAFKISIPPTVGILVHVIKGTSLASLIGFVELSRAGQIINNSTYDPIIVFGLVGICYFILCWPLSLLSARLERKRTAA